jgi:phosphoglycerate kinase
MGKEIKCAPDCKATDEVKSMVDAMAEGDVIVLENTRFYKGETKNDAELAESMASLADLFVNDAFGTAHRAHSSTEGVTKFLKPCVSGYLLKKELDYLKGAVDSPKKPMAAIVGGAKVSTKIPVIESMLDKVDKLIIGGGMVFTFLKARGLSVGKSLVEEDFVELATKLEKQAKEKGVEIILPKDVACGDAFPADGKEVGFKVVPADAIPDDWLGLDNGPEATEEIKAALADCKTIIWNGPMGVFESSQFNKGTYDIAECLAELTEKNGAITIIGGGDSVSAVNKSGLSEKMSHISTGGGASLELLEGKVLPGVAALDVA